MHPLMLRVLQHRDFQSAGELYTVSNFDIITDLHSALVKLKQIFCDASYVENLNDQKVVEIVLGCITAAIRETNCMETYAAGLVDVLEACLNQRMYKIGTTGKIQDTPHCKIASDLLGSLFLFYAKQSVMTVAIPVAIKALNCGNVELARNTTSYLSLAAIHNGRILAQFALQIISNIMSGNYALVRVLPQVYQENREPFHAHLPQIFKLLKNPESDTSEKLSLLQLASSVSNTKPELITPHLPEFEEFLRNPSTCTAVLHIFLSLISMNRSDCLIDQLSPLRIAARSTYCQNNLATIAKVVGVIGRINDRLATVAVHDLLDLCKKSNANNLPILLKEVEGVAEKFPASVAVHLDTIQDVCDRQSSTQKSWMRIRALCMEENRCKSRNFDSATSDEITIIPVPGVDDRSQDSLDAAKRSPYLNDAPIISSGIRTVVDVSDSYLNNAREIEFDREMRTMVDFYNRSRPDYENRSRASLTPSNGTRTTVNVNDSILDTIDKDIRTVLEWSKHKSNLDQSDSRSRNSCARSTPNNRSQNENITVVETPLSASKRSVQSNYSQARPPPSYQPPKGTSLNVPSPTPFSHTAVQIGKDGRPHLVRDHVSRQLGPRDHNKGGVAIGQHHSDP
uniref:PH domain-containing protein n=1 Tax=Steinernema glaseri TaxID=37863 RepID=A0A1I7ZUC5_9BILA